MKSSNKSNSIYNSLSIHVTMTLCIIWISMFFNKLYDTDFGNLVPLVLANVLHVNIGIIWEGVQGYNARVIHANACNNTLGNILVYKTPDHYDSIILKPAASGDTSQGCDRYKRIGGSPIGRHSVSVGDPPRSSGKHRFSDGSLIPDSPNTSGDKSMTHDNTPFTMISPDRATNTKRPHRNGIDDKPIALNDFISDLKKLRYCNPKNMIIGYININSLRNKYDPVRSILQKGLCDIFTLSETKLDESFLTAQFLNNKFCIASERP